jgi:hypothetical protein
MLRTLRLPLRLPRSSINLSKKARLRSLSMLMSLRTRKKLLKMILIRTKLLTKKVREIKNESEKEYLYLSKAK